MLWLVRGLGTAMLHGATTAIFAMIVANARRPASRSAGGWCSGPGWSRPWSIHSAFNHVLLPPVAHDARSC